ncbi:hypothetical protein [Reyranella sp.]|uniref:hypothetical protein n=1 Tax=Reyranella sp. TaxID=1929291 RepID=UPI003D123447
MTGYHRNGNSQSRAVTLGPGRKFGREQVEREIRKAAQGEFDALVMLALDHPGPRAKVLGIVAEVLAQLAPPRPVPPKKPRASHPRRSAR